MKRELSALVVALLLASIFSVVPVSVPAVMAQTGDCPTTPAIGTNMTLVGITCNWTGPLTVYGGGSLKLVGAQLLIHNNVTLAFNNSTQTYYHLVTPGALSLNSSSSLDVSQGSVLSAASLQLNASAGVSVSGQSLLNVTRIQSTPYYIGSVSIVSSTVMAVGNLSSSFVGSSMTLADSNLTFAGFPRVSVGGITTMVTGTGISFVNDTRAYLGGKPFATSSTSISDSMIISSGKTNPATPQTSFGITTSIYGNSSLTVSNSYVSSSLATTAISYQGTKKTQVYPNSTLVLAGGQVNVQSSTAISSAREYFGYAPNAQSVLNITSTSTLKVTGSLLKSGQTSGSGTYRGSAMTLQARDNMTLTGSTLQSEGITQTLVLTSLSQTVTNLLLLSNDKVETGLSGGGIVLRSSYFVDLEHTNIYANQTGVLKAAAYQFTAVDSLLNVNFNQSQVFGTSVSVGKFVNSSIPSCPNFICLSTTGAGTYSVYDRVTAKVVSSVTSLPVSGATVTATYIKFPFPTFRSTTNGSGWATFPVLVKYQNQSKTQPNSLANYVVQASSGSDQSPQILVPSGPNMTGVLQLASLGAPTNATVTGLSPATIAAKYNLIAYTYLLPPAGQFALGNYIGAQYVPYFTVVSNAVPISFKNNATNSEVDFSTAGTAGSTFYFILVYPSNLTQTKMTVIVDGVRGTPVSHQGNATILYDVFALPAGSHSIALSYLPPSGYYEGPVQYPRFFPPLSTIVGVLAIFAVGLILALLYAWSRDRPKSTKPSMPAQGPAPAPSQAPKS